ncbi:MAG: T9SS type A sorting domain-containing protein, partial [Ignavibacteriota bacterium]
PARMNQDATTTDQIMPAACIDQKTGAIYSLFYDYRNSTGSKVDAYVARSGDGGLSFSDQRITPNQFITGSGLVFTDYIAIAASDSVVFPMWKQLKSPSIAVFTAVLQDTGKISDAAVNNHPGRSDEVSLAIYPNPASDIISLDLTANNGMPVSIRLADILGRNVATICDSKKIESSETIRFDVSHFPEGTYFCTMISGSSKLIKRVTINH